jgi:hypothetical protein
MVKAELLGEEVGGRAAECLPEGVGIDVFEVDAGEVVTPIQQNADKCGEQAV